MPVNPFFASGVAVGSDSERKLLDDLMVESIQIHGISCYYLPRTNVALDKVYLEDARVAYNDAWELEMYLKSWDGFQGDGSFMSTMGVEIRDQVVFSIAITRFLTEMGPDTDVGLTRPREGDLIWYPFNAKLFEIKYVEKFVMHYPLGGQFMYDVKCELFEYSGQTIATGIAEIDAVMSALSQDAIFWAITDESGNPIVTESDDYIMVDAWDPEVIDPLDDSARIADEAAEIIDLDEYDVWSDADYR